MIRIKPFEFSAWHKTKRGEHELDVCMASINGLYNDEGSHWVAKILHDGDSEFWYEWCDPLLRMPSPDPPESYESFDKVVEALTKVMNSAYCELARLFQFIPDPPPEPKEPKTFVNAAELRSMIFRDNPIDVYLRETDALGVVPNKPPRLLRLQRGTDPFWYHDHMYLEEQGIWAIRRMGRKDDLEARYPVVALISEEDAIRLSLAVNRRS